MTRFYNSVKRKFFETRLKTKSLQKNILGLTSVLVLGFLTGNLFGTILTFVRKFIVWDGWIVASLIIIVELISYISYKPLVATSSAFKGFRGDGGNLWEQKSNRKIEINRLNIFRSFFNFFKIGLLIGFFVDAFKVGS